MEYTKQGTMANSCVQFCVLWLSALFLQTPCKST